MTYNPSVKVFYGTNGSSSDRIEPAPMVNISTEMSYSNDNIIGYSYIVSLSGAATALKLSTNTNQQGITSVSDSVNQIRKIFSLNGGNLYVVNSSNEIILEGRGGIIRSISFDESPNNWVNYVPYKVEIEFSEIFIDGCSITENKTCTNLSIDGSSVSNNLVNVSKYKIREFNDSWSFNLGDEAYNNYSLFQNQYINIEYTISAKGKHHYNDTNKTLPAWEQAKNFAQDRLYNQVKGLITSILNRTNTTDGCSGNKNLSQLYPVGTPGSLNISGSTHKIYNETISCEVGEAEGSFSATYKAILKHSNNPLAPDCIHTFNKTKALSDDNKNRKITLSVQGSITGLIPGGLINTPNTIELPRTGKLFLSANGTDTKYSKAIAAFNQIATTSDIDDQLKDILEITNGELFDSGAECVDSAGYPRPSSFTVTHDYTNGVITYSGEYDSDRVCLGDGSYRNISINVEDSVEIVAEFVIPGRANGPIIQKTGATTPKRISVNIEGASPRICCPTNQISNACAGLSNIPLDLPNINIGGMIMTQNQTTVNTIDGSYSISRSYIGTL